MRQDFFLGSRHAPASYQDILAKYGRNFYGENIFRLIWGPSRKYLAGGYWEETGKFGYRWLPKYGSLNNRWMIERYMPPSVYGTSETWEARTVSPEGFLQAGPYPAYGGYECASVFSVGMGPGGYVPLEPGTVDLQARLIWMGRTLSIWDIRGTHRDEAEEKERASDRGFDEMWDAAHHTRPGLTVGPGGRYDGEAEINAYRQRLLEHQDAWVRKEDHQAGFYQAEGE